MLQIFIYMMIATIQKLKLMPSFQVNLMGKNKLIGQMSSTHHQHILHLNMEMMLTQKHISHLKMLPMGHYQPMVMLEQEQVR